MNKPPPPLQPRRLTRQSHRQLAAVLDQPNLQAVFELEPSPAPPPPPDKPTHSDIRSTEADPNVPTQQTRGRNTPEAVVPVINITSPLPTRSKLKKKTKAVTEPRPHIQSNEQDDTQSHADRNGGTSEPLPTVVQSTLRSDSTYVRRQMAPFESKFGLHAGPISGYIGSEEGEQLRMSGHCTQICPWVLADGRQCGVFVAMTGGFYQHIRKAHLSLIAPNDSTEVRRIKRESVKSHSPYFAAKDRAFVTKEEKAEAIVTLDRYVRSGAWQKAKFWNEPTSISPHLQAALDRAADELHADFDRPKRRAPQPHIRWQPSSILKKRSADELPLDDQNDKPTVGRSRSSTPKSRRRDRSQTPAPKSRSRTPIARS